MYVGKQKYHSQLSGDKDLNPLHRDWSGTQEDPVAVEAKRYCFLFCDKHISASYSGQSTLLFPPTLQPSSSLPNNA